MTTPTEEERKAAAEKAFKIAANTRCCDEWPECTHILAAYEAIVNPPAEGE